MAHEGHDHDGHGHHHHPHDHIHDHAHGPGAPGHGHDHDGQSAPHGHPAALPSAEEHRSHAPAHVASFLVTCSDSRDPSQDRSAPVLRRALEGAGHSIVGYRLVRDDAAEIRGALETAASSGARAVIFTGGTGVGRRDVTVETLEALFDKRLPGFGELFRMLSFQQIGAAAWLSRATAGTWQGMAVFALPGSPNACELAVQKLILPELGHVVRELSR